MTRMKAIAAIAAAGLATTAMADEFLLIFDSTDDVGRLFDPHDGSLVDDFFIDGLAAGHSTPVEGVMVEDEIWVSDQLADALFRYDAEGVFLGLIEGGMDNIRGIEYVDGVVYVSNSGTGGGAPGDAIIMFDSDGNPMGSWPAGDPFDVLSYNGDLVITNIADERLDLHQRDGEFIEVLSQPGFNFPEQVSLMASGNLLVGTFSSPAGVYEINPDTGDVANYWAATGVRGVWELGNGNILFTNSTGLHSIDPATGAITLINEQANRFISLIDTSPVIVDPCYADCDESGELDFFDFLCFQNEFAGQTAYADCDESGELDFFDFLCFQNAFAEGCP